MNKSAIFLVFWPVFSVALKGAYKVLHRNSPDLIVIERTGKALLPMNDHGSEWLDVWATPSPRPEDQLQRMGERRGAPQWAMSYWGRSASKPEKAKHRIIRRFFWVLPPAESDKF